MLDAEWKLLGQIIGAYYQRGTPICVVSEHTRTLIDAKLLTSTIIAYMYPDKVAMLAYKPTSHGEIMYRRHEEENSVKSFLKCLTTPEWNKLKEIIDKFSELQPLRVRESKPMQSLERLGFIERIQTKKGLRWMPTYRGKTAIETREEELEKIKVKREKARQAKVKTVS